MASVQSINQLSVKDAQSGFVRCCGSLRWAKLMTEARPFSDDQALYAAADRIWLGLNSSDWIEAFSHHPRIGEKALREKYAATAEWAAQEQKGATRASEETLRALAQGNADYEKRFGRVFLVCATGKSADEMLKLLKARLSNDPSAELKIAAQEQSKITRLRLEKWIQS